MNEYQTLQPLIELYLLRCEVEGKSPRTVRAYRDTLRRFVAVLAEDEVTLVAEKIRTDHLYAYLGRFTGLSLETRHRYFREVRCFFNWLVDAGYLEHSPFRGMRNVRLPQRIVRPFSAADVGALLATCDRTTQTGARDYAALLVLLDTGVRLSELVQLDMVDLDIEVGRLRIRFGKGNKQRVVPFASRCAEALRAYVALRGEEAGPLFCASNGHGVLMPGVALRPSGLRQMLLRRGREAGVTKVHAHRFRHTFATWAIQHDARELDVQYLLGHSSPDMVRRYSSSYRSEQAATRHARFSPADQMLAG